MYGVVTSWAWVSQPRPNHPLQRPFAWALIRLDGADTAMLHVVDAGSESAISPACGCARAGRATRRAE